MITDMSDMNASTDNKNYMTTINFDKRNLGFDPDKEMSELEQYKLSKHYDDVEKFKKHWVEKVKTVTKSKDEKKIRKIFDDKFRKKDLILENTDEGQVYKVDPLEFTNNIYKYGNVIVENGTFFANQKQLLSPAIKVQSYLMQARYDKKEIGIYYQTEGNNAMLGELYDLQQGDIKISMNTYYGASQNPYSKFYNKALGAAITCKGRSIVATSALIVESIMANYIPTNFNAIAHFISTVEEETSPFSPILRECGTPTVETVLKHLHVDEDYYMYDSVKRMVSRLSTDARRRLYYKNNLYEWLEIPYVVEKMTSLLTKLNKEGIPFLDPYEVPECITEEANDIYGSAIGLLLGYYWDKGDYLKDEWKTHRTHSTQETIKEMKRQSVVLIDTDSNMILIEDAYQYLKKKYGYLLTNLSEDDQWFTLSNLATKIATECVDYGLAKYIDRTNTLPEYNGYAVMKNEFLYKRFVLTSRKKNYVGLQSLKEGKRFPIPKLDVKGLMYKKSNVNGAIGSIVSNIVEDSIMRADDIDIIGIKNKMYSGAEGIKKVMQSEEGRSYYVDDKLKETMDNYAKGEHRVKAVKLWNALGLGDYINPPANFQTVAVDLVANEAMIMEKYPDVHQKLVDFLTHLNRIIIMDKIDTTVKTLGVTAEDMPTFQDSPSDMMKYMNKLGKTLGNQINENNKTYKRTGKPKLAKTAKVLKLKDITKIAIPTTIARIPEFILDIVDYIPNYTQVDSLAAPVVKELNLKTMRNNDDKVLVTNILNHY